MSCMFLRRIFHTAPEQKQGRMGYVLIFQVLKLLGGVFKWYFNGFQVSSPGPRHNQCEWFLHNISPGLCPGDSQYEYTIRGTQYNRTFSALTSKFLRRKVCTWSHNEWNDAKETNRFKWMLVVTEHFIITLNPMMQRNLLVIARCSL